MKIFQKSVTNKYIKNIEKEKIDKAFKKFQKFYGDKLRLVNIMQLKEENYQEGFLREIFVQTLGYKINPDKNYNLTTEYKNQKDARKADGAIIKNGKAICVIELKSTKTKNLESIKEQAFGYKNNQPDCKYVITSNFQSLRFYVDNATEYEEFNLFNLDKEQFKFLYLLISKESIFKDLPAKLKKETKLHEVDISDKLYADYKLFKDKIFKNIVENNKQYDKLILFKKTQKLLDRFLFVFFAEDCGLIPPNTISKIVSDWKILKKLDFYQPLYKLFKNYFSYLNKGKKIEDWGEIPAYNGGLFRPDEILDKKDFKIDDIALEKDSLKISAYDFNTEIDVNILGHIFEHSLNEIEEITAKLEGTKINKKKSKRKKDGIFYTPKYITKYIVENTVGTICNEKKDKLKINNLLIDEKFHRKDGKLNQKGKQLYKILHDYKKWLLTLKILDHACGSGAFLNQTLDFLIAEHKMTDDLISELTGDSLRLYDTDKAILENNIYGVDINEESVDIAKLSLWLRTAQKGRPLSDLSNNIKCGNSLIHDPEVAGDKAFDWNIEFKEIIDNGGFDVVIGNPPYFNIQTLGKGSAVFNFLKTNYSQIYQDKSDILFYFIKKGIDISKNNVSFIVSNAFQFSDKAQKLRNWLIDFANVIRIINFDKYMVFKDASITSLIITIKKEKDIKKTEFINFTEKKLTTSIIENKINNKNNYSKISFEKDKVWALIKKDLADLYKKIDSNYPKLYDLLLIGKGMETAADRVFTFESIPSIFPKLFFKKRVTGLNIDRYSIKQDTDFLLYFEDIENFDDLDLNIQKHLLNNKFILKNRADKKRRTTAKWWNYTFAMHKEKYNLPKLVCSRRAANNIFAYDENFNYLPFSNMTVIFQTNNNISVKYILTLINSKLLNYRYKGIAKQTGNGIFEYFPNSVGKIPIKEISQEAQQPFIEKSDLMLSLNKALQTKSDKFIKRIKSNLEIHKISRKLQYFYNFDFKTFLSELRKQKIKLKFKEQDDWEDYFDIYKTEINELQIQINQTDKEIDKMVYQLYELTDEEIKIVESSVK